MKTEQGTSIKPSKIHLEPEQVRSFHEDGYLIVRDFVDPNLIFGLRQDLVDVLWALLSLEATVVSDPDRDMSKIDTYYWHLRQLSEENRSVVYDLIKNLPGLVRLSGDSAFIEVFKQLYEGSVPCISNGGTGIRIDTHLDNGWASPMHQEFPAHLRSLRGAVVWLPLVPVDSLMGPVDIWSGSHREGLLKLRVDESKDPQHGVTTILLEDIDGICDRYEKVSFETQVGDVVFIDYLTVHASSPNRSPHPRWTVQWRIFDALGPLGRELKWRSGWSQGMSQADIACSVNRLIEKGNWLP